MDPLNPALTSDKPGVATCGMPLEPVYGDEEPYAGGSQTPAHSPLPGAVRITPLKQQLIGVQIDTVEMAWKPIGSASGRIAPDENLVYRLLAGGEGWICEVGESTAGSLVLKDQIMATFYSGDFLTRQSGILSSASLPVPHATACSATTCGATACGATACRARA